MPKGQRTVVVDGKKACSQCSEWKPSSAYQSNTGASRLRSNCRACTKINNQSIRHRRGLSTGKFIAEVTEGKKPCGLCRRRKPLSDFYIGGAAGGRVSRCKDCSVATNADRYLRAGRNKHLRLNYGISADDFDRMLTEQGGACAICGSAEPSGQGTFKVDHCHSTGLIRGLLCHHCNVAIGSMKDDPDRLRAAIEYLEKSRLRSCA